MAKYSVIIPVYNAEKTLRRCVDSVLNQNYGDMELLLINDGSTDGSLDICNGYRSFSPQVRVIDKPNGGVSSARNAGLRIAEGEYILFVDSDDYVSDTFFSELDNLCPGKDYDYVQFSYRKTDGKHLTECRLENRLAEGADACSDVFSRGLYDKSINSPWGKRYKRAKIIAGHLEFPEDISIGEDKLFNLKYAFLCQNALYSDRVLYYVSLENQDSLSRKPREDLQEQFERLETAVDLSIAAAEISEEHRRKYIMAVQFLRIKSVYADSKRLHIRKISYVQRLRSTGTKCRTTKINQKGLPFQAKLLNIPVRLRLTTVIDAVGWILARK